MADDIEYSLDPSGYLVGVNQVDQANQRLQQSLQGVVTTSGALQRAYDAVTPKRATIAGLGLLAAGAAQTEQSLSGMSATAAVTDVNVSKLAGGIRAMAREMPMGFQASRQLTEQLTRQGIAGAGSERQIIALAKASQRLSGATGEGPSQLASGIIDLSRATGNQQLDIGRIEKLSDSLTTISAKSGASATGILSFSKGIAPMAQNAGIGATGILGISSAFAKLGEDGLVGVNTVNKMLTDMNRAVREGSPEMRTYAQIVGKTQDEFQALFKSNPAEALTQITESIAKAGPQGQRVLEQLGIEGVRGQRSLQALSASGGLRSAVEDATTAYGSGSTNKAAEAAFGGLNDSITELRESSRQAAEAFGAPLLGPLTAFTNLLKGATGGASKLLNSSGSQGILSTLAWAGVAGMGIRAVASPIASYMLGRQALTSAPVRGLLGGFSTGYGMAEDTRTTRFGRPVYNAINAGTMPRTIGGRLGERAFWFGHGLGETWREMNPPGGRSLLGALRSGGSAYGQNLAQTYFGMLRQQAVNATHLDPTRRTDALGASRAFQGAWRDARLMGGRAGTGSNWVSSLVAGTRAFNDHVMTTGRATATFRETMRTAGSAMLQTTRFAVQGMGGDVARGGRGLMRALGPELGIGLGIAGVSSLIGYGISNQNRQKSENESYLGKDIAATINSYRESIGRATPTSTTFASLSEQNTQQLAANASARGYGATRTLTNADWDAAQGSKSNVLHRYAGSASQIAAQIRTMSPSGVTADELQAIKVDLARQLTREQAQAVLNQLPDSFEGGIGGPQQNVNALIGQTVAGLNTAGSKGGTRYQTFLTGQQVGGQNLGVTERGNPLLPNFLSFQAGGGLYKSTLTDDAKKGVQSLSEGINQQFQSQSDKYQGSYARQQRIQAYNAALKAAVDKGDGDLFYEISKRAGQELGGKEFANTRWSASEFQKSGGDFSAMVARQSGSFAATRRSDLAAGMNTGTGGIKAQLQEQTYTAPIRGQSVFLGDAFDARSRSGAAMAMTRSLEQPEDVKKQSDAMNAVVDSAKNAGMSMSDLAVQAAKAASATAEGSDAWKRLQALQARGEQEMRVQQSNMTPGQAQLAQYQYYSQIADITPGTDTEKAQQQQAREQMMQLQDSMRQRMVARLQMQRQYDIQVERQQDDHQQQMTYAREDYETSVSRAERNFNIQRKRQVRDFHISVERAEEDFGIQRKRQLRDFHTSEVRQEQDFNVARQRQVRDYGIAVKRQEQDYQVQVGRQRRDFAKQETRQIEDYNVQRGRQIRDFNLGVQRGEEDYQLSRSRQMRDFNIGLQRGEADFMKSRERQIRDFNTSMKRQVEDMAKGLMDPYKRIQTQATWDGKNLLVNLGEQNAAMTKQLSQLDQLRKAGLSERAIDQLGLGKVENAQQVNNLAMDASSNADIVRQLNEAATERDKIAAQFQADPSNKEAQRAREDFEKSLKDTEEDYKKSVQRGREDLARSLSDSETDYKKSVQRGREDLARSLADSAADFQKALARSRADFAQTLRDQEADMRKSLARGREDLARTMADQAADFAKARTRNRADLNKTLGDQEADFRKSMARNSADFNKALTDSQADLKISLGDMEKDFTKSVNRQETAFQKSMSRMAKDIAESDKTISGNFEDLAEATNKAIHGKAVNWQNLLKSDTESWVTDMQKNVIPKIDKIFGSYGVVPNTDQARSSGGGRSTKGGQLKAEGGRIEGYSPHPKADDQLVWATAGEFMHPVDAVNYYGVDAMEALRKKKIPKELINGYADGGLIQFAKKIQGMGYDVSEHPMFGGVHPVHTAGSQHYNKQGPGGGGAIDVNADPWNSRFPSEKAAIDKIIGLGNQYGLRAIWQVASHFDHAHFDISTGANMLGSGVQDLARPRGSGAPVPDLAKQINEIFSGLKGGGQVYQQLTESFKSGFLKAYGDLLSTPLGDTGAHSADARANQAIARRLLSSYGFSADQMSPLISLWNGESGWNQFADNPSSDAYGIPQSLPGSKMASAGADWRTNPETQIRWGLQYIKDRYGNPAKAWQQWNARSPHWYDNGGFLQPGQTMVMNGTGAKEPVLTDGQWKDISTLADLGASMVTAEQGRALAAANGTYVTVNNNQTYTYDQRVDFTGSQVTVQSQDPEDMGRRLEKKAVADRLTQTRGVRWGQP